MIIMKLAVNEACEDGIGTIYVESLNKVTHRVYVNGGSLPDGSDSKDFLRAGDATKFAMQLATDLINESLG